MSKDLQKRGFRFVGSTICYAFMQATGMVNDHLIELLSPPPGRGGIIRRRAAVSHVSNYQRRREWKIRAGT